MPVDETLSQEIEQAAEQMAAEHVEEQSQEQADGELEAIAGEATVEQTEEVANVTEEIEEAEKVSDGNEMAGGETREEIKEVASPEVDDSDITDELSVPDLSDEVIGRAIRAGMSLTDVLAFPSEVALERVVIAAEQVQQSESQDDTRKDLLAEFDLDPDKYEPEIIELFDRMKTVLKGQQDQIRTLGQEQAEIAQASQQAAERKITQWFDGQIKGLGKDFTNALGTGGIESLDRGSSQFAKREAIANQMSVLLAGYKATGQEAPPREDVFNAAARLILADEFQRVSEKRLASSLEKRSTQHIQRAGSAKAKKTQSAEEEVAAILDARFG